MDFFIAILFVVFIAPFMVVGFIARAVTIGLLAGWEQCNIWLQS